MVAVFVADKNGADFFYINSGVFGAGLQTAEKNPAINNYRISFVADVITISVAAGGYTANF